MRDRVAVTIVLAVLCVLAVLALTAHRGRENARAMRSAVAKLGLPELLRQLHRCEIEAQVSRGSGSRGGVSDPAYCQEVTHAVASQPLQLVDVSPDITTPKPLEPDDPAAKEQDRRAIRWPGKTRP
jgi:hypothetical protein